MDLGRDKDDFDPLVRTGSVGSKTLTRSSSLGNLKTTPNAPPPTSSTSDTIMSQLSGLDLELSVSHSSQTGSTVQNGLGTNTSGMLQPLTLDPSSLVPLSSVCVPTSSTSGPTPLISVSQPMGVMIGGAPVNYGGAQMTSHLAFVPGSVPYRMQPVQGVGHQVSNLSETLVNVTTFILLQKLPNIYLFHEIPLYLTRQSFLLYV